MSTLLQMLETLGRNPTMRVEEAIGLLDANTRLKIAAIQASANSLSCLLFTPEEAAVEASTYNCALFTPEEEANESQAYSCLLFTPEEAL